MKQTPINRLLGQLHYAACFAPPTLTDGQALAAFVERREARAFEMLLRRHGRMVLGVCRRLLGNPHDADDAFQATFLVLVRKADSIKPREAVGNWLYGVAYRTALVARAKLARRRLMEKQVEDMPHPQDRQESGWSELRPLVDQELHRLPDKYRLAVVLCDLEGRSRKEVARQLAIPEGTLSSRLAMGRKQLAQRLVRHGFACSGASLGILLVNNAASACVAPSLLAATTKTALLVAAGHAAMAGAIPAGVAALTKGVMKTMFLAKMKTLSLVLFGSAALSLGTGGLWYQTQAGEVSTRQDSVQGKTKSRAAALKGRAPDNAELQDQLERAQKETAELKAMVERLQKQLEEERRKAEIQARLAEKREADARQAAEKERYAATINTAKAAVGAEEQTRLAQKLEAEARQKAERERNQNQADKEKSNKQADPQARAVLLRLKQAEEEVQRKVEARRIDLTKQLQDLEDQQRKMMAEVQEKRATLLDQFKANKAKQEQEGGDKLDRILQRLERLEKRLDEMDRGRSNIGR